MSVIDVLWWASFGVVCYVVLFSVVPAFLLHAVRSATIGYYCGKYVSESIINGVKGGNNGREEQA